MIKWLKHNFHGKRIIYGADYLTRFYLRGDGSGKSWELYLHRIYQEDGARKPHNHPWPWFMSIILSGWYDEIRSGFGSGSTHSRRRWFNYMPSPAVFHRIVTISKRPVWTLVLVPPKDGRTWGFVDFTDGKTTFTPYNESALDEGVKVEHF